MEAEFLLVRVYGIQPEKIEHVSGKEIMFQAVLVPRHHLRGSYTIHCFVRKANQNNDLGNLHALKTEDDGEISNYMGVEHTLLRFIGDNSIKVPEGYEVAVNSADAANVTVAYTIFKE